MLEYTQAESAQCIIRGKGGTVCECHGHVFLRPMDLGHCRVQPHVIFQEFRSLALHDRLEPSLVNREDILRRELEERIVMRLLT